MLKKTLALLILATVGVYSGCPIYAATVEPGLGVPAGAAASVGTTQLQDDSVTAAKVQFNYAASASEAGSATSIACVDDEFLTGAGACVSSTTLMGGAGDFQDGGEAGGADRSLGNTDAFDISILANNVAELKIFSGGGIGIGATLSGSERLALNGDANFGQGIVKFSGGSAASPSLVFVNDSGLNTGIFQPDEDIFAITTGGVERLRVDSAGKIGVGTTAPGSALEVVGQIRHSLGIIAEGVGNGAVIGNARGTGAIDLQTKRTAVTQVASGAFSVIGGGELNTVSRANGTIGGGFENEVKTQDFITIGGGFQNVASGFGATIAGGENNVASGDESSVGGGAQNEATGNESTVAGGFANDAIGNNSMVPGGTANVASGDFSFAAGRRAKASAKGSFLWADSKNADLIGTTTDQFLVRAQGGFFVDSSSVTFTDGGSTVLFIQKGGNVGIGTASPLTGIGRTLQLSDTSSTQGPSVILERVDASVTVGNPIGNWIFLGGEDGTEEAVGSIIVQADDAWTASSSASRMLFGTTPSGATNDTERMRIDSSGNVGIGTTSPGVKLDVAGRINAVYDRARSSGSVHSFAGTGFEDIPFDNEDYDEGGIMATTTVTTVTIASKGIYVIVAGIRTSGTNLIAVRIQVDTGSGFATVNGNRGSGSAQPKAVTTLMELKVGDLVKIQARVNPVDSLAGQGNNFAVQQLQVIP